MINYETRVIDKDAKKKDKFINYIKSSKELSVCTQANRIQFSYENFYDKIKEALDKEKEGDHRGIRWITTVDKKSLDLIKIFLNAGVKIRHINNIPMSFGVSDKEIVGSIANIEGTDIGDSIFTSNEPKYIRHFQSLFEHLWKNSIDATDRIASIEEGVDLEDIEVIPNAPKAREFYLNILKNAQKEIMIVFPTTNAFLRQKKMGAVQLAEEAVQQRNVKIRILMPKHESTEQLVQRLTGRQACYDYDNNIDIRYIEQTILDTQATILIVDQKVSLVMEIRDDSKRTFDEAIGLSTYSTSKAGVLSYVSIFENLWLQTELYQQIKESSARLQLANEQLAIANEQLKVHDKMQQEFINVAAHELRTPIQPILSLTELLRSKIMDSNQHELLDVIIRNAKRLQRLSDNILDVTRIESGKLKLSKERFDLNEKIHNIIRDVKTQISVANDIQIALSPSDKSEMSIFVEADKVRIFQVISNLLSNAIKFTDKEGTISISLKKREATDGENKKEEEVIVSIRDSGAGIPSEIRHRLFSKFATKSDSGTGLGLFISKSIVEAHGGKIWVENNASGRGTTFYFTLPLANS